VTVLPLGLLRAAVRPVGDLAAPFYQDARERAGSTGASRSDRLAHCARYWRSAGRHGHKGIVIRHGKGATLSSRRARITILVDNDSIDATGASEAAAAGLASEHGLAFWVESDGRRILFDTGQGPALRANAPTTGVDLTQTDILVLSHGHYDHTGGVDHVLGLATRALVYCHPAVAQTRYSVRDGKAKPIGIPARPRKALKRLPAERLHWVLGPTMLTEHVGLTGPVPRATGHEDTGGPFYLDKAGWRPDPLEDDLALWIHTGEGLVVCFGCAHSGVVKTLRYIREITHSARIRAAIGGLHLIGAGGERLTSTAEALLELNIPLIVPCHCTGKDASRNLTEVLGRCVSPGAAGMVFEF
jgi:7,8-dihydropterin-6-yl-methyl-4-(beta-D-ribofuranosyl)aminobenzene 5'-phosphate synthase